MSPGGIGLLYVFAVITSRVRKASWSLNGVLKSYLLQLTSLLAWWYKVRKITNRKSKAEKQSNPANNPFIYFDKHLLPVNGGDVTKLVIGGRTDSY
jgi:hypothetical protein